MHRLFTIATRGPGLYEFTDALRDWIAGAPAEEAVLTLFIRHTSASLLIQENADPDVRRDLTEFLHRLVPPSDRPEMRWMTHTYEGPDDMPAHAKAAILPVSLQIPVISGRMVLGTWQGVYLFEHRQAPHRREVMALLR
ncbi:secondary thiamine-phosphate synthase enzyme YjbQ [Paenirhodobacter populi]|uniref:YjbQ family protein n=1 Tax=Paenirhodobacter populi TaxID=2306993 RepID=A0A443JAP0_9RHOB|nr:secondary thiamine-phosphate synthase enzyme YjbQ [Sinirhodobacter populi]RWR17557.1 YjbQ family protein [Sinirhodobacter populi]RWR28999.1 YjbQ family protein [Sinirhodobacter populi]